MAALIAISSPKRLLLQLSHTVTVRCVSLLTVSWLDSRLFSLYPLSSLRTSKTRTNNHYWSVVFSLVLFDCILYHRMIYHEYQYSIIPNAENVHAIDSPSVETNDIQRDETSTRTSVIQHNCLSTGSPTTIIHKNNNRSFVVVVRENRTSFTSRHGSICHSFRRSTRIVVPMARHSPTAARHYKDRTSRRPNERSIPTTAS